MTIIYKHRVFSTMTNQQPAIEALANVMAWAILQSYPGRIP